MRERVGTVTHYFNRIHVAVIALTGELKVGDMVHIYGHTTDFIQRVGSMEVNHRKIESAGPGEEIALEVVDRVRRGDTVYKVSGEDFEEPSFFCGVL